MQTKSNLARADTFSWSWWSYSAVMPVSVRSDPGIIWRGLNSCVESGEWFSCSPGVDPAHTELVCTSNQRYDHSTGRQSDKKNSFPWADHEEWEYQHYSTIRHGPQSPKGSWGGIRVFLWVLPSFWGADAWDRGAVGWREALRMSRWDVQTFASE